MWQNYPARGLRFSQTYMLKDGLPGELKHLRTLWATLQHLIGKRKLSDRRPIASPEQIQTELCALEVLRRAATNVQRGELNPQIYMLRRANRKV